MSITHNKKGDLSFTIGLILSIMLIVAIAVSCTNIFREGLSGRPDAKFKELVSVVKAIEQKPAGSSDVVVGYLGSNYALLGFSSTATTLKKLAPTGNGADKSSMTILLAERPADCTIGKACLCLLETPTIKRESATAVPYLFKLEWEKESCAPFDQEFFNMNRAEHDSVDTTYWKGGFMLTRNENIGGDRSQGAVQHDVYLGFHNILPEPQITIEKSAYGIALCMDQPCIKRGMEDQQKLFVEAHTKFAEAEKEYDTGNYAAAETLFNDLMLMEAEQQGKGFPGNAVGRETGMGTVVEGTEYILNGEEHDKTYFLRAMSMVKQKKYDEGRAALTLAETFASDPAVKNAAKNTRETIDCTVRSFAVCTNTEPKDICYRGVDKKTCNQCTTETTCATFDNAEACATYSCSLSCAWNNKKCAEAVA
ncbi:MAG: hypothetical protein Q7R76_02025 [Candidatus Woesearchaeota archaeon]|nr:hypothetical protein [Candidatus Woesearchaeota archaeon]